LFTNSPMKRLYAAAPLEYEDNVLQSLGRTAAVHLVGDYSIRGFTKVENVEKCDKYIKLRQRIASVLSSVPVESTESGGFLENIKASFSAISSDHPLTSVDLKEIEDYVADFESHLDGKMGILESLQSDIGKLKELEARLLILEKHNLRIDQLGDFRHIFVKAGLLQTELASRLGRYTEGTSATFSSFPESRKEDFIVITGLTDDKSHLESALPLLNFSELTFPSDIDPDPKKALHEVTASITQKTNEVKEVEAALRVMGKEFLERARIYEPVVQGTLRLEEARSNLSRTEKISLVHGWIPANKAKEVTDAILAATSGLAYVKLGDPAPHDNPPVRMNNRGPLSSFELLTKLRGTPDYREVDPTPIMAVLFTIMFGLMFGDLGNGLVLAIIGLIFFNLQHDFLKVPARAVRRLGGILLACGISSMFFGVLFGEVFLLGEVIHPILFSPFHNQTAIIVVALIFGVIQIGLGLVLKIVNMLRKGEVHRAIFAAIVLAYYVVGVLLAADYVSNMSFSVFTDNPILTGAAIGLLAIVFAFPMIEGLMEGEVKIVDNLTRGFAEFIETFISTLTNSISYVRLAAFAIAHGALGMSAVILASTVGAPLSYLIMNALVIIIEGLAILIQSMRLTYYEFFTKFFSGGGMPYRPFTLPPIFT